LVALRDERQRAGLMTLAAGSADAAHGRAQSLYYPGQIDLLPLLYPQRTRLTVRLSANESQTQLQLASVRLFKALGGGWQEFEPVSQSHLLPRGSALKTPPTAALLPSPRAALLAACPPNAPPAEALRPVRTVDLRYDGARDANRYTG